MMTVDQFLVNLLKNNSKVLAEKIPHKDLRILLSLNKSLLGPNFITENQGKLLIKIFQENKKKVSEISESIFDVIDSPSWSKSFRPVDHTKKIYLVTKSDNTSVILIEFSYSSSIKQKISKISKEISHLTQLNGNRLYQADFTEKNIVSIIDGLSEFKFTVDEKLKNLYNTIKSWDKNEVKNQFFVDNINHAGLLTTLKNDVGNNITDNNLLVSDRSIRYQYFYEKTEKNPENLVEIIAKRKFPKVWVDKNKFSLEEVFQNLIDLKRLPVLLVFDSHDTKNSITDLKKISEILEKNGIFQDIGIYFRLNNDEYGKSFNQFIAQKRYNSVLDENTKLVGVQNGKIPKFLIKNPWTPMSVVSIGNNLRHNKTAVYANCCDLIISYAETEPLYEPRQVWE